MVRRTAQEYQKLELMSSRQLEQSLRLECGCELRLTAKRVVCDHGLVAKEAIQAARPVNRTATLYTRTAVTPHNPWSQIHSRYGQALASPDTWRELQEREWYDNWKKQIPCGQCKSHWSQLEKEHPVDLSCPEMAFRSLWFMHNEVSRLHSGKPTLTYEQAIRLWAPKDVLGK